MRKRLQQTLKNLADLQEIAKSIKGFLDRERGRIVGFHDRGMGGFDFCQLHSRLLDYVIEESFQRAAGANLPDSSLGGDVAILAVGGFGRRELCLHSDIDIMILHQRNFPQELLEAVAADTFTLLWDSGMQLGHSVRALEDIPGYMSGDIVTASTLMEGRFISGSENLFAAFRAAVKQYLQKEWEIFCHAKCREARARHQLQGDSPFVMQPNVKESAGGLRDANTCMWLMMALDGLWSWKEISTLSSFPVAEIFSAVNGMDFLLRVRNSLHITAGRKQDVLDGEAQVATGRMLGFESDSSRLDYENFMREYYHAAAQVHGIFKGADERFETKRHHRVHARRMVVNEYLMEIDKTLYLRGENFTRYQGRPVELMEIFAKACQRRLEIPHSVLRAVQSNISLINDQFRYDPGIADMFKDIIANQQPVAWILRAMNECGFLGEYLPEFGELYRLVHHDPYHSYTIDEHLIRSVEELDALIMDTAGSNAGRQQLLKQYKYLPMLRLALLLHDVGKGTGGAHEEAAIAMVPEIARRLQLESRDVEELIFLIREHALFSIAAEERNWQLPDFISNLVAEVGTLERWRGLYLAAYCDLKAVGKRVFNKYRDAELREVFEAVAQRFGTGVGDDHSSLPLPAQLKQIVTDEHDKKILESLLNSVPERYFLEVSLAEGLLHVGMMDEYANCDVSVSLLLKENYIDIWVVAADVSARFSEIAAILNANDLNIVYAAAYTRKDGILLDHFRVQSEVNGRPIGHHIIAGVKKQIIAVIKGSKSIDSILQNQVKRLRPLSGLRAMHRPSRVNISNKISADYSVIDITTQDRIGLLYLVTRFLAGKGIDIHFARIATRGTLVTDVFYVNTDGRKVEKEPLAGELLALLGE
ncbi:hypothetical protein ACFL54_08310 [Planctomycetota bacterium]